MLGPVLVSLHNIRFYQRLMADIRQAIGSGRWNHFRENEPRSRLGPSASKPVDSEPEDTEVTPTQASRD
jgi:queuine/archaeosine tRNA-ribosyltransferase